MKMGNSLKGKTAEVPWFVQTNWREAYSSSWEEWSYSADLCSLNDKIEGMAWSCTRNDSGWVLGKCFSPEGDEAPEQAPRAVGIAPTGGWRSRSIWPVLQTLGLDLGVLCGPGSWTRWFFVVPFQIIGIWFSIFYRIFYDTMILRLSVNFFIVIIFFFLHKLLYREGHT